MISLACVMTILSLGPDIKTNTHYTQICEMTEEILHYSVKILCMHGFMHAQSQSTNRKNNTDKCTKLITIISL